MSARFDAEAVIARMAEAKPQALALGEIVALAASVDRRLLRKARRALTGAGPEAEADLYFSELVLDRNPARFVFRPEAALALRRRLAARPAALERAWALVSARHAALPPTVRTEELLQWHALKGDTGAVRDLLRACVSTLVEQGRQGFAAWAIDAVARMDPMVRDHEEYRMLGLGAAMRTGARPQQIAELSDERLAEWLEWLAPDTGARTELGFTLVEGGIEFGPVGDKRYSETITLPGRFPQLLDIREAGGKSHALNLRANAPTLLETTSDDLVITTEDGTRLRVRPPGQRFVNAERAPRVHISYELETYGARKSVELPFVIGVLGDFAGLADKRPPLAERRFREIDCDNFDSVMAQIAPQVRISVPNQIAAYGLLECDLRFGTMEDFSPDAIVHKVPQTNELLQMRDALNDLLIAMDGKQEATELVERILADDWLILRLGLKAPSRFGRPHDKQRREARQLFLDGQIFRARELIESFMGELPDDPESPLPNDDNFLEMLIERQNASVSGETADETVAKTGDSLLASELPDLIAQAFRPRSREVQERIEREIAELCAILTEYHRLNSRKAFKTKHNVCAFLDSLIGKQINHILADPGFRRLESAWRGIDYLVRQTETGPDLKIRLFDLAESELLEATECDEPLSPGGIRGKLFREIYESEFSQFGGEPFTAILCDFGFGDSTLDLQVLRQMGAIGECARTTFIAPAAPEVLGMESWENIQDPRDIPPDRLTLSGDNAATQAFRQSDASRHVALAMPPIFGRARYGNRSNPVERFAFDEDGPPLTISAIWPLGMCLTRAFRETGWLARISGAESGGTVSNLPLASFGADTEPGVTQGQITDRRELELASAGLIPLVARRNTDSATFFSLPTLHNKAETRDARWVNSRRALPLELTHARFAHHLMCMHRDRSEKGLAPRDIEIQSTGWLLDYVSADDAGSDDARAVRPLRDASLLLGEDTKMPDYLLAELNISPAHQFDNFDHLISGSFPLPFEV